MSEREKKKLAPEMGEVAVCNLLATFAMVFIRESLLSNANFSRKWTKSVQAMN